MSDLSTRLSSRTAPYRAVLASRMRSQRSHRASFRVDLLSSVLVGVVELAEVTVLYLQVDRIGGLDLAAVLLVFAISDTGFSLADMVAGHCDTIPTYIRAGTLDVFYLRPQPLLLQLMTSDLQLRRLARASVGVAVLVVALVVNDLTWDAATIGLLALSLVCAPLTFAALFVWAAGAQFFLVDGAETTNAFVYGGRYAATQPATVWSRPLLVVFGFVFPMAFTAFLPVVTLLDLDGASRLGLPDWIGWTAPLAVVWAWALAALSWRLGVRHYQGGGG
ncbi:ABC transporter permease [Nocardioides plantarum]|uniref:ABC transporter permease n=1 Tax=Nocardioides plantarum TaxID=29299 RepID=A0ABV5K7Q6_9ACTN|nr:ABC-2 family transporter protein [Nocardioides plantarum]